MKIHDRTLPEIFGLLPWPYKIVVGVGALFVVFTLLYVPFNMTAKVRSSNNPAPLQLRNIGVVKDKLDPSIAVGEDGKKALLFTALKRPEDANLDGTTEIISATTSKSCDEWTVEGPLFQSKADELIGPDGVTPVKSGMWRIETPTVVFDAEDKGREWKAYAYKYFWAKDVPLARLYGFIISATAPTPQGPWSPEEWVFSAQKNMPPPPYAGMVAQHLNDLHPSLADIYFYSRPSVLAVNDVLLMSLTGFIKGKDTPDRVILIASTDHGKSWKYLGAPLTDKDMPGINAHYTALTGATLIEDNDAIYLSAVAATKEIAADGTLLIPFQDVLKASLRRHPDTGVILPSRHIPRVSSAPTPIGGGYATYNKACDTGVITSEFSGLTGHYELMNTKEIPHRK